MELPIGAPLAKTDVRPRKEDVMGLPFIARVAVIPLLAIAVTITAMSSRGAGPALAVRPAASAEMMLTPPPWRISLETMDHALAGGDIRAAETAWRNAYGDAIRSRGWEALLAVGEGSLRIGDHVVFKQPFQSRARGAWLSALVHARERRSVHGVVTVAEAFATLGDTDVVARALSIADDLAAFDTSGNARRHVLSVRKRLLSGAVRAALR
jgi:hypothetical protein